MWDAINEIAPDTELAALTGDYVVVFFDFKCDTNRNAREQVERLVVRMRGDSDLQFAFAPKCTHTLLYSACNLGELPAAIFLEEGVERERCAGFDDVIELVEELISQRR